VVLKIRKLLIFRDAGNAKNDKIAVNWNVSGTQSSSVTTHFFPCDAYEAELLADVRAGEHAGRRKKRLQSKVEEKNRVVSHPVFRK
jgi:hypothetical protein